MVRGEESIRKLHLQESNDPQPIPGGNQISGSDSYTPETRRITYIFLLNLGLEDNKKYIRRGFEKRRRATYLLLRGEVVDDVEEFPDLFRGLALDHVGDGFAPDIAA